MSSSPVSELNWTEVNHRDRKSEMPEVLRGEQGKKIRGAGKKRTRRGSWVILEGILGVGAHSVVYKAQNRRGSLCALKELAVEWGETSAEDGIREARLLSRLDHPYIVGFKGCFLEGDSLHIATELAQLGTLADMISRARGGGDSGLDETLVWKWALQMALGLDHLHSCGILHRDVKPANVLMFSPDTTAKLGDLGLSKETRGRMLWDCVGTPLYQSPELCGGGCYGEKADVWAYGCCVFEMMTGSSPFQARNRYALLRMILSGHTSTATPQRFPKKICSLTRACLSLEPAQRPTTTQLLHGRAEGSGLAQRAPALGVVLPEAQRQKKARGGMKPLRPLELKDVEAGGGRAEANNPPPPPPKEHKAGDSTQQDSNPRLQGRVKIPAPVAPPKELPHQSSLRGGWVGDGGVAGGRRPLREMFKEIFLVGHAIEQGGRGVPVKDRQQRVEMFVKEPVKDKHHRVQMWV